MTAETNYNVFTDTVHREEETPTQRKEHLLADATRYGDIYIAIRLTTC